MIKNILGFIVFTLMIAFIFFCVTYVQQQAPCDSLRGLSAKDLPVRCLNQFLDPDERK